MDISKVVALFGNYYKDGNSPYVLKANEIIREKSDTTSGFSVRTTESTVVDFTTPLFSRTLQAFQKKFTPLGALDFEPERLHLAHMKIDVAEYPDELENSALMFMEHKGLDRTTSPIIPMIGNMMLMNAKEEFELNTVFKGVKATPADGTASTAGTEMDGIRKKIRGWNTASLSNMILTGSAPSVNKQVVEWINEFYWGIPKKFRPFIKAVTVSDDLYDMYIAGMDEIHNVQYDKLKGNYAKIWLTDCLVEGVASQRESDMIWATVVGNKVGAVKKFSNKNVWMVGIKDLRQIQMSTDWHEGYGCMFGGYVFHNDRDLTD